MHATSCSLEPWSCSCTTTLVLSSALTHPRSAAATTILLPTTSAIRSILISKQDFFCSLFCFVKLLISGALCMSSLTMMHQGGSSAKWKACSYLGETCMHVSPTAVAYQTGLVNAAYAESYHSFSANTIPSTDLTVCRQLPESSRVKMWSQK